jgi:hypothetical protein
VKNIKATTSWIVLFGFVLAALFFTYPLVLHVGNALRGSDVNALGDPLLNTWAMTWNIHKLARLDFKNFFDGNNFYPQTKTLLYSEHLMSQTLLAMPVYLLTKNPVLAYNFVFLAGLVLSAFGVFCLARRLTGSTAGSFAAGLIYAFCPFITTHYYHLQVVSAWGIPFAFFFLHRFFEEGYRLRDALFFTAFYVLQSWANGYYALFITVFAGLWIFYQAVLKKSWADLRFWTRMALFAVLAGLLTAPFYLQYLEVHNEMGFTRGMDFYARLSSYLAAPRFNWLYGRISEQFVRPEGELFPGFVAFLLAAVAVVSLARRRRVRLPGPPNALKKTAAALRHLVNGALLVMVLVVLAILGQDGISLRLFNVQILQAHNLKRSLALVALLVVLRLAIDVLVRFERRGPRPAEEGHVIGYLGILVLAVLFTFGPNGPYLYLYNYVPGFKAIRVPSRCDIFVMFALSVLAAFGLRTVLARLKPAWKATVAAAFGAAIILEYVSIPIAYHRVPLRAEFAEVYQVLARAEKPPIILELPLPSYDSGTASSEAARMYFSTIHWSRMVNGYSGYFPPLYTELCRRSEFLPFEQIIDDARALNVDYILLHLADISDENRPLVKQWLKESEAELRLAHQDIADNYLIEVLPGPVRTIEMPSLDGLRRLPRDGWTAKASALNDLAPAALDGNPETRWDTGGPQKPGDTFELDLGRTTEFQGVSLVFGPSGIDFPRGYRVEVSMDGTAWTEVGHSETTIIPIRLFAKPKDLSLNVQFPLQKARFVRVTNLGEDRKFYWSIYEAYLYD